MAKAEKNKESNAVGEATAAVNATAEKVKRANPLTNENQTHVDQARFCVKPKAEGEAEVFTDNVHFAFAKAGEGYEVIDHRHGNRRYDGKVPSETK